MAAAAAARERQPTSVAAAEPGYLDQVNQQILLLGGLGAKTTEHLVQLGLLALLALLYKVAVEVGRVGQAAAQVLLAVLHHLVQAAALRVAVKVRLHLTYILMAAQVVPLVILLAAQAAS
jgi:hypothetical protein